MLVTILSASLAVAVMSTVFAAIISLVDYFVNNYGEVKIDINAGKKILAAKGGSSLLATLGREGIFIPSSCGGRATCGVCKVKVVSGGGQRLPTENPFLNEREIAADIRLSCQVKLKADIAIEIPETLFAIQRHRAVVDSLTDLSHDTKELRLRLLDPAEMHFEAGQFVQLVIPPYDNVREPTLRAYSVASVPGKINELEFIIRLVPGGIATTYIHTKMKAGEEIEAVGPVGEFCLHEGAAVMICIAGGSGMAPLKSILFDMFENKKSKPEIWYFYGAVSRRDLYHIELFGDLEKKWPAFHFVPALSNPKPEDAWQGETGLVTAVAEKYLEKINPSLPREGYLCGSPGMIDASIAMLVNNGVTPDRIYYDKFS